nr:GNAT family N-acetyltransferase [Sphingobium amiense]
MASPPTLPRRGVPAPVRWQQLASAAAEANAFYAPDMLAPALAHLAREGEVHMIEAWSGEQLIGLLPLVLRSRHGRLPLRCVGNWMHPHCFFGAPLLLAGREQEAWALFLDQLDAAPWARGFLHLEGIDAAGPNAAAIEATCVTQRRGWREIHRYERAMLRSDLDAEDYWTAQVRPKKRKELRRLQKRLADMGEVETRLLDDPAALPDWCEAFLALEAAGWKGANGTAMANRPDHANFFRDACAAALDGGRLHMLRMDLDGRAIAMLVNFRHLDGAFSFKIAIDETLGRFSPGVLIEIANLHAVQGNPAIAWMDSCAAPDHPMIDSLWAERRTIVQYRIALRGRGFAGLQRRIAFAIANQAETLARLLKGLR